METAQFRFYAQLNDFLPAEKQCRTYTVRFNAPQSVKHLIESEGVPHPEVFLMLASGEIVNFDHLVRQGERIAIYPLFQSIELTSSERMQPTVVGPPSFLLDNHLGKLARYMRLLGFDTEYPREHLSDGELAQIAKDQGHIMLTRDRRLLMRRLIDHGYCLRSTNSQQQLAEVMNQYGLHEHIKPWLRCLHCNGLLQPVPKSEILHRLEPKTKKYYTEFRLCQRCGQIYWRGSHFKKLERIIEQAVRRQHRMGTG